MRQLVPHFIGNIAVHLLSILVLLLPALPQNPPKSNTHQSVWDEMLAKSKLVESELAKEKVPEWAGKYDWGSLGFSGSTLLVSPKSGFVYRPYTDYFPNDIVDKFDFGQVEATSDHILLRSTRNLFGDERFYFVRWGERRLLIPETYIPVLFNFFNAGCSDAKEYSDVGHMYFPTKEGDVRKRFSGRPAIPAEYEKFLFKVPLTTKITSIVGTRVTKQFPDSKTHSWYDQYTTVVLNVGSNNGIWKGMTLFGRIPESTTKYYRLVITKASETTSEGEVYQGFEGKEPQPPQPGFVFSSRLDQEFLDNRIRPWACI